MAIDFPNTPTTGQLYTVGNRSWRWDGTAWRGYSIPTMYRQDAAPASPIDGDQWFETDTGRMFVRYGTAWVELGNATDVAGALQPSQVTSLSAATTLTSDDVFPIVDNPSSAVASSKITYGNLVTNVLASPTLTGTPTAPTATAGTNTTQVATTAFVRSLIQYQGGQVSVGTGGTTVTFTVGRFTNAPVVTALSGYNTASGGEPTGFVFIPYLGLPTTSSVVLKTTGTTQNVSYHAINTNI
jgi:hypothetical protein